MTNERDLPDIEATEDALQALLVEAGLGIFPEEVRHEVDGVLAAGQSLEPAARHKLIEAAKRGTREWNLRQNAALETLLFEARRRRGQNAEAIAATVGLDPATMRSIERGEAGIGEQPAAVVASWALELTIDRDVLGEALGRSLGARGAAPAYAGERNVQLQPDQKRFVADVLRAYDEGVTGTPG